MTGASGFIGFHIANELLKRGWDVRCLMRQHKDPQNLTKLGTEIISGDLRDKDSLNKAMQGIDVLFHTAALYSFWIKNIQEMYDSNVLGTQNIFEIAYKNNVQKIIYTSTVGTIGIPHDGTPGNENTPLDPNGFKGHYKVSKYQAEQIALKMSKQGIPIVIVNPTAPMGPNDIKPTPTGKMILDFLQRKMPGYTDTGLNVVDVRDVAIGHILAFEKGKIGERYILGNQNLTLKEILLILSQITGLKSPKIKIPFFILPPLAQINAWWAKLTHTQPRIEPEAIELARKFMFFDSSKAIRELGLPQRPVLETLQDATKWFCEHHQIKI